MTWEPCTAPELLTYEEAAQVLRFRSTKTISRLVAQGKLEKRTLGDRPNSPVRVTMASVNAFVAAGDVAPGAADDADSGTEPPR